MIVNITFPSALQFWLSASSLRLPNFIKKVYQLPQNMAEGGIPWEEIYDVIETYNFKFPLHIAVPGTSHRSRSDNIYFHVLHKELPKNSFFQLSENVYISSPELSLLESAKYLSFHTLIRAGTDLCANYVRNKNALILQSKRDPVTDPEAIRRFLKSTTIPGVKKTRTAAKYILGDSNSPVETIMGTLCNLPIMYGGYAEDDPVLNLSAKLTESGAEYLGRDTCLLDIGWKKIKVGVEYDSNLTHLDIDQHYYDKKKATALSISGYRMMYVTAEQLSSFRNVENMMMNMRKLLGLHPRTKEFEKYLDLRYQVVKELLFDKDDKYGLFN